MLTPIAEPTIEERAELVKALSFFLELIKTVGTPSLQRLQRDVEQELARLEALNARSN